MSDYAWILRGIFDTFVLIVGIRSAVKGVKAARNKDIIALIQYESLWIASLIVLSRR